MTEQIENTQEIPLFEPSASDIFSEPNKRKLFLNRHAMCDYISMVNSMTAAQFRMGHTQDGQLVYELVYNSEGN